MTPTPKSGAPRVGMLAPMKPEIAPLIKKMGMKSRQVDEHLKVQEAMLDGVEVVATITGIGMQPARDATARLLDAFELDHVLVVGIAGGVGPTVDIGDLVLPAVVVEEWGGTEYRPHALGGGTASGTIISSDTFGYPPDVIQEMIAKGVVGVDMETAACAAVCEQRGQAWSAYRAISDRADDDVVDLEVLEMAGPDGGGDVRAILRYLVRKPWKLAQLARLAKGGKKATDAASDAAIAAARTLATR